jgi:hypothetical protein
MTAPSIQTLAEVLGSIESLPWNQALYLDMQRPWTEESHCAVLDPDDIEDADSDDDPEFAVRHGLRYALTISATQDIVDNAQQQKVQPSMSDLIQAFNYYYDHDAFIEW